MDRWTHTTLGSPRELAREDFELIVRRIADDIAFGVDPSMFVGPGLEYASSRPYQPGDPTRTLNWRLTGRTGRPYVKEYEVLRRMPAYIVVDTSASMRATSRATSKLDLAIWAAAAIGLICLRRMNPVALLGQAGATQPPRASLRRADLWLAIDDLCAGAPLRGGLGPVLQRVEASARTASMVIVISDFHDESAVRALVRCALKHDCLALRLVDPAELGRLRAGFYLGAEAETGRAFVGHGRTRWADNAAAGDALLGAGIDVLTLHTDAPLAASLRRFLASRGTFTRDRR